MAKMSRPTTSLMGIHSTSSPLSGHQSKIKMESRGGGVMSPKSTRLCLTTRWRNPVAKGQGQQALSSGNSFFTPLVHHLPILSQKMATAAMESISPANGDTASTYSIGRFHTSSARICPPPHVELQRSIGTPTLYPRQHRATHVFPAREHAQHITLRTPGMKRRSKRTRHEKTRAYLTTDVPLLATLENGQSTRNTRSYIAR